MSQEDIDSEVEEGLSKYKYEINSHITRSRLPKDIRDEILISIDEFVKELVSEDPTNLDFQALYNYSDLVALLGTPDNYITEYVLNRNIIIDLHAYANHTTVYSENQPYNLAEETKDKSNNSLSSNYVILVNILVYLLFCLTVSLIYFFPFSEIKTKDTTYYSATIHDHVANSGSWGMVYFGPLLLIIYFLMLTYTVQEALNTKLDDHITYIRNNIKNIAMLAFIVFLLQYVYIQEVYNYLQETDFKIKREATLKCKGENISFACQDNSKWDKFQWAAIWILFVQIGIIFGVIVTRLQKNKKLNSEPETLEMIESNSKNYLNKIQVLYRYNTGLIVLFVPIYLLLYLQYKQSGKPIIFSSETTAIMVLDFIITVMIGMQMIYFIGLTRNHFKLKGFTPLQEFSYRKYRKQHWLYLVFIFTKFLPDIYFFNTDGTFWLTNVFVIIFLFIMWAIEFYFYFMSSEIHKNLFYELDNDH